MRTDAADVPLTSALFFSVRDAWHATLQQQQQPARAVVNGVEMQTKQPVHRVMMLVFLFAAPVPVPCAAGPICLHVC